MFVIMLLLTALSIVAVVSVVKTREIEISTLQQEAENLLDETGSKINTVYLEGDGFMMNVTLPEKIISANYSISTSSNFLVLTVYGNTYSKALITDVSGNFSQGSNMLRNVGGEVTVL
ncbi:MAG: hypothetical protein ISS93_03665 [Candidatus Aenigmarchaeota archaeon]|nr:hypothetical protein [Candidatus Aenigmarchaeota archaeon]